MDYLSSVEYKDCLPFIAPVTSGKVVKVYDGDTITIASKLPYLDSPIYRFSVRINGIDCPEIKTKCKDEKEIAILAKKFLENKILNKIVNLGNIQKEKYGRLLADVFLDGEKISDLLLSSKLAIVYSGGTKKKNFDWKKNYIN
jgi:endonuclease YncB( thermonuclease family)